MIKECPACGHTKGKEWEDGDLVPVNPDGDDFIHIEGSFHVKEGYYNEQTVEVNLYACPECNNVIFQD